MQFVTLKDKVVNATNIDFIGFELCDYAYTVYFMLLLE
jgi:hypothetical protein